MNPSGRRSPVESFTHFVGLSKVPCIRAFLQENQLETYGVLMRIMEVMTEEAQEGTIGVCAKTKVEWCRDLGVLPIQFSRTLKRAFPFLKSSHRDNQIILSIPSMKSFLGGSEALKSVPQNVTLFGDVSRHIQCIKKTSEEGQQNTNKFSNEAEKCNAFGGNETSQKDPPEETQTQPGGSEVLASDLLRARARARKLLIIKTRKEKDIKNKENILENIIPVKFSEGELTGRENVMDFPRKLLIIKKVTNCEAAKGGLVPAHSAGLRPRTLRVIFLGGKNAISPSPEGKETTSPSTQTSVQTNVQTSTQEIQSPEGNTIPNEAHNKQTTQSSPLPSAQTEVQIREKSTHLEIPSQEMIPLETSPQETTESLPQQESVGDNLTQESDLVPAPETMPVQTPLRENSSQETESVATQGKPKYRIKKPTPSTLEAPPKDPPKKARLKVPKDYVCLANLISQEHRKEYSKSLYNLPANRKAMYITIQQLFKLDTNAMDLLKAFKIYLADKSPKNLLYNHSWRGFVIQLPLLLRQAHPASPDAQAIAKFFGQQLLSVFPTLYPEGHLPLDQWAHEMDFVLQSGTISASELAEIVDWYPSDAWWKLRILDARSLLSNLRSLQAARISAKIANRRQSKYYGKPLPTSPKGMNYIISRARVAH
jgi:hypothetical protein